MKILSMEPTGENSSSNGNPIYTITARKWFSLYSATIYQSKVRECNNCKGAAWLFINTDIKVGHCVCKFNNITWSKISIIPVARTL